MEGQYSSEMLANRAEFTKRAVKHYQAVYPEHNILVISEEKAVFFTIPDAHVQHSLKSPKYLDQPETFLIFAFHKGIFTKLPGEIPGDWAYEGKYTEDGPTIHFHPWSDAQRQILQAKWSSVKPLPDKNWVSVAIKGSNGKYVSNNNGGYVACDRDEVGPLEMWILLFGPNGVALKGNNKRYMSSENGDGPMKCDSEEVKEWELFIVSYLDDTRVTLKGNNGKYVTSENGVEPMTCTAVKAQEWEIFTLEAFPSVLHSHD